MKIYKNLDISDLENETWKDILDYEGDYQVSNIGRVKSFKKWHGVNERILKQSKNGGKYLKVRLYENNNPKTKKVHILVFETFIGKIPKDYDIHHISEDKENNFVENLKSIPKSEHSTFHNTGDKNHNFGKSFSEEHIKKLSENKKGEKNSNFKLTNQKIIDIQSDIKKGDLTQVEIGKKYGVHRKTVSRIKQEKLNVSKYR